MLLALIAAQAISCFRAQTQTAMTQCSEEAFRRSDAAMTAQWRRTLAFMHQEDHEAGDAPSGPGYADALLASQRAWLGFRDGQCRVEGYAARGGTLQPMLVADCQKRLSAERTRQLAALAKPD